MYGLTHKKDFAEVKLLQKQAEIIRVRIRVRVRVNIHFRVKGLIMAQHVTYISFTANVYFES